jgi:hypothetical protein
VGWHKVGEEGDKVVQRRERLKVSRKTDNEKRTDRGDNNIIS